MADKLAPNSGVAGHSADCGFSLVELLVVTAILAVLAIGVTLSMGKSATSQAEDLKMFEQRFSALRSRAIHGQKLEGLYVTARGFQGADRPLEVWQPTGRQQRWKDRVRFETRGAPSTQLLPSILFLPNGTTTAFEVIFQGNDPDIRCASNGVAGLSCVPS